MADTLSVDNLILDPRLQFRLDSRDCTHCVNPERLEGYWGLHESGIELATYIDVARLGNDHYVFDGFHSLAVYVRAGRRAVKVRVTECQTWEDVIDLAIQANTKHGDQMADEDLRGKVRTALQMERYEAAGGRVIARACGCSRWTVDRVREEIRQEEINSSTPDGLSGAAAPDRPSGVEQSDPFTEPAGESPGGVNNLTTEGDGEAETESNSHTKRRVQRGDQEYEMDASNIGRSKKKKRKKTPLRQSVKDALGNEVPDGLRDTFGDPNIQVLEDLLETLADFARDQHSWAAHMKMGDNLDYAEKYRQNVQQGRPYAVCPKCQGDSCRLCKSAGYLTQAQYEFYTKQEPVEGAGT